MYNKGFMYTANKEYNTDILDNDAHLSGENHKENVYVFPEQFINNYSLLIYYKYILPQFKKIIKQTIYPIINELKCPNSKVPNYKCSKLLGYDIMIDKNYKLYLAEINARTISFKYPPKNFLNNFYTDVLNLIIKKKEKTQGL